MAKKIITDSDGEDILIETIGELNGICTGDTITDTNKNGKWFNKEVIVEGFEALRESVRLWGRVTCERRCDSTFGPFAYTLKVLKKSREKHTFKIPRRFRY